MGCRSGRQMVGQQMSNPQMSGPPFWWEFFCQKGTEKMNNFLTKKHPFDRFLAMKSSTLHLRVWKWNFWPIKSFVFRANSFNRLGTFCGVFWKLKCSIKMRACPILPWVMDEEGSKKAALILIWHFGMLLFRIADFQKFPIVVSPAVSWWMLSTVKLC